MLRRRQLFPAFASLRLLSLQFLYRGLYFVPVQRLAGVQHRLVHNGAVEHIPLAGALVPFAVPCAFIVQHIAAPLDQPLAADRAHQLVVVGILQGTQLGIAHLPDLPHPVVLRPVDDGGVMILYIIAGIDGLVVLHLPVRQRIQRHALLHHHVSYVLLVVEHPVNRRLAPGQSRRRFVALPVERIGDLLVRVPMFVQCEHFSHYRGFFFHDAVLSVLVQAIAEQHKPSGNSGLVLLAEAPRDVLRDGHAFLLGEGRQHRHEHLGVCAAGIDVFLFEVEINALFPEHPNILQAIHGVARKAGDGLDEDVVDFSRQRVLDHLPERRTLHGDRTRHPPIRVNLNQLPARMVPDFMLEVCTLGLYAGLLCLTVRADAAVRRHALERIGGLQRFVLRLSRRSPNSHRASKELAHVAAFIVPFHLRPPSCYCSVAPAALYLW